MPYNPCLLVSYRSRNTLAFEKQNLQSPHLDYLVKVHIVRLQYFLVGGFSMMHHEHFHD